MLCRSFVSSELIFVVVDVLSEWIMQVSACGVWAGFLNIDHLTC